MTGLPHPPERRSVLPLLRARPELLVGPVLAVWLLLELLPITFGRPFLGSLLQTAEFRGNAGQAFPLTYATALALFGLAFVALRSLGAARRLLVAAAFPFAYLQLYEIPYDLLGEAHWPRSYAWATWPIVLLLNASWLALGLTTSIYWRWGRAAITALAATAASFALWWTYYWPRIGTIEPPLNPEGSGYMLSKTLLAATLALALWGGRSLAEQPPADAPGPVGPGRTAARTPSPRAELSSVR